MKQIRRVREDEQACERAQMLLAAGMVLLMALLSMAVYGVKLAGLGTPHHSGDDATIEVGRELQRYFQPLLEERVSERIAAGMEWEAAAENALVATHDDLLHHGEIRGVEIKLMNMSVSNLSGTLTMTAEAGISDSKAMLELPLLAEYTPD